MTIAVNGEPREVPAGATLPDLLATLGIDPEGARGIAVAVNEEVVRRARWGEVTLAAGDTVEVITAVQGG
ncbi:MAG: sulfur carrier protein ThiS [Bacteroidetes bacterium]|nr:thiamine biosynthesis protein ThiS [Rhodothermaceae bacterium RA]RMH59718.1 MAG: sulfur carrier protein ThiS [Bacteroidota bacterium]